MKGFCALVALVGVAASSVSASTFHLGPKSIVVDGTIVRVTPQAGEPDFNGASTIDRWYVTVDTAGVYSFNALSWEVQFAEADRGTMGTATDVNGDGEIAFLDTYLRLFRDDGDLNKSDQIGYNDDRGNFGPANADGSIYLYDSYMSRHLEAGNYVLAIGAYHMSVADVLLDLDVSNNFYPVTWDDTLQDYLPSDHGDYRLTMGLVPAPGAAALMALAGLSGLRRRR